MLASPCVMMNVPYYSCQGGKSVKVSDGSGDYTIVASGAHCYIVET
jgi:hypothetical protein